MNNKNDSNNREQWLTLAAQLITSTIIQPNSNKPLITDYRVSIAPPTQTISAQCHNRASSTANINEVFISGQTDDSLKICADLTHELVHVQDDCQSSHRGYFRTTMENIGFKTPMTATHLDNASDEIRHQLARDCGAIRTDTTRRDDHGKHAKTKGPQWQQDRMQCVRVQSEH